MVVAEVPLWVIHSTALNNGNDDDGNGGDSNDSDHAAAAAAAAASGSGRRNHVGGTNKARLQQARHTLGLLLDPSSSSSSNNHATTAIRKNAIYSVDTHPTLPLFCTAGGDGKVKLWHTTGLSVAAVAPDSPTKTRQAASSRGGKYTADGAYVSTSESEQEEDGDDESNDAPPPAAAAATTTNGSSQESNSNTRVNDLTNVVRKKKNGGAVWASPSSGVTAAAAAAAAAAAPASPVARDGGDDDSALLLSPPGSAVRVSSWSSSGHGSPQRLLGTLSSHSGSSVLCVRFSPRGHFLASAGDDGWVCIYAPSSPPKAAAARGNLVTTVVEPPAWSRVRVCRGHNLDAVGLAWSPDEQYLVSCSLDSATPIIVWDVSVLTSPSSSHNHSTALVVGPATTTTTSMVLAPFKILGVDVHTSMVKGVCFDPAGSYLASSGDDPAVCIWRAHDDWGLERKIDEHIFRKWRHDNHESAQVMTQTTMFRRLSWSTDGAFVCATNATVKNKDVASTITREGWNVSHGDGSTTVGAVNLVGHKQPIVVSRHATHLLDTRPQKAAGGDDMDVDSAGDDAEAPDYALLMALGDKRGFITVWSTNKSRPVFKLQCSESRCTVTDLAWSLLPQSKHLLLLVSLMDGTLVALKFSVPDELGPVLNDKDKARVFQVKYGIDTLDEGSLQQRLFAGSGAKARLIENPLQMTWEANVEKVAAGTADKVPDTNEASESVVNRLEARSIKDQQNVTTLKGKKRVQPLQIETDKRAKAHNTAPVVAANAAEPKAASDPVQDARDAAKKASQMAESSNRVSAAEVVVLPTQPTEVAASPPSFVASTSTIAAAAAGITVPFQTPTVLSREFPAEQRTALFVRPSLVTVECTNTVAAHAKHIAVSISRGDRKSWNDEILGTLCTSLATSSRFFAVGTVDGAIQIYSTSPSSGWQCGVAIRAHPPLIFGQAIVNIELVDDKNDTTIIVLAADGGFGVYGLRPGLFLQFKGSVASAMHHASLGLLASARTRILRFKMTDSGRLLLLLSTIVTSGSEEGQVVSNSSRSGALKAFVYDKSSELWMKVSDGRTMPLDGFAPPSLTDGPMKEIDDMARAGSMEFSIGATNRLGSAVAGITALRAYCEDRMACCVALNSPNEFQHWLAQYARILTANGHDVGLRMLVDMLSRETASSAAGDTKTWWWLSDAASILDIDRSDLVTKIVLPEMSKNRNLQRLVNEVSMAMQS